MRTRMRYAILRGTEPQIRRTAEAGQARLRRGKDTMGWRDCETCGNEIPADAAICRFCRHPQSSSPAPARQGSSAPYTLNIKAHRPTVEEGVSRLARELQRLSSSGVRLVRVIHGYGSSGVGGVLRDACRSVLTHEHRMRRIRTMIEGEAYTPASAAARALKKRYPVLRRSERTDTGNPGITLVEL